MGFWLPAFPGLGGGSAPVINAAGGTGLTILNGVGNVVHDIATGAAGGSSGISLYSTNAGANLTAGISGNTVHNIQEQGFGIIGDDTAAVSATMTRNVSRNNTNGILVLNTGTGVVNADLGGGSLGSAVYNSSYSNVGFDIVFADAGTLMAENNYWGGGAPATLGGTVDGLPFLTSDPIA